jgi:hypothetical protein
MMWLAISCGISLAGVGCMSLDTPASAGFASVKIAQSSEAAIRDSTLRVFAGDGFVVVSKADELVFEREGTQRDVLAYGGALDSSPVRIRVRVQVIPLGGEVLRLQGRAFAVRNAGDSMEDEIPLPVWRRGPFQDLMNKVRNELSGASLSDER